MLFLSKNTFFLLYFTRLFVTLASPKFLDKPSESKFRVQTLGKAKEKRIFLLLFSRLFVTLPPMKNSYFAFRQFTVHQERCAMKVGTDGTLLGAWASLPPLAEGGRGETFILDVGTGTGLIALMMAQRFPDARVVGIDIDADAVLQAQENVAASPFANRITILQQDFSTMHNAQCIMHNAQCIMHNAQCMMHNGQWSAIVCNPPFFTQSLPCPDDKRTMARHDDTLSYRTLASNAWQLLSDDGELSVIVPADQQSRMEAEASLAGFSLCRVCLVKTSASKPPKRVLLAFRKHPVTPLRTTLTIGSAEYHELTKDFYL